MNEFLEECRREWKRLGVPDPVADEMTADLAADLDEAEAEGVPAEQVLGTGASDPRAFARAWAGERGLITRPQRGRQPRSRLLAAVAAGFALTAIAGAAAILASPSTPRRLTLAPLPRAPLGAIWLKPTDAASTVRVVVPVRASAAPTTTDVHQSDTRTVGWVLLIVGIAGVVPLMLFLSIDPAARVEARL